MGQCQCPCLVRTVSMYLSCLDSVNVPILLGHCQCTCLAKAVSMSLPTRTVSMFLSVGTVSFQPCSAQSLII